MSAFSEGPQDGIKKGGLMAAPEMLLLRSGHAIKMRTPKAGTATDAPGIHHREALSHARGPPSSFILK
ncbi:MAG: hypothetical protein IJ174_03705 [Clostridia bacterium]|nr:hypothetical protein [Clostridia bacterium]